MTDSLAQPFGPPPFKFTPSMEPMRVRAFTVLFRLLATLFVFGIEIWMYLLWQAGQLAPGGMSAATALGWPLAALGVMLYTWWHIITSHTTLTSRTLHQSWIWDKKMEVGDLAYGKLIRLRGFDWLIAPRLYARTLLGKFAVFYAADAAMLGEFERLIEELKAFRNFG